MAYLKQNVSFYGTEDGFLMHLKKLFTNSAFSISCIEENYNTFPHYIILGGDTLRLKICSKLTNLTSVDDEFSLSMGFTNGGSNDIIWLFENKSLVFSNANIGIQSVSNRQLGLLIVKTGTGTVINMSNYNTLAGRGDHIISVVENPDAKLCMCEYSDTNYHKAVSHNNENFKFAPYHTLKKDDNEFFLDPEMPAWNDSNNAFITNSTDITGLGGAVKKTFYTMTNGDKYYAIENNIAIKLGEEVTIDEE
ncbi:MAG: hypothetical protein IJU14_01395 [Clostridia bacterium]|nr:hypothetical protein [Clostridia bacterium]